MHFVRCKEAMAKRKTITEMAENTVPIGLLERLPVWQLDIVELTGHNLEARGERKLTGFLRQDGGCSTFTPSSMRRMAGGANGQWGFLGD